MSPGAFLGRERCCLGAANRKRRKGLFARPGRASPAKETCFRDRQRRSPGGKPHEPAAGRGERSAHFHVQGTRATQAQLSESGGCTRVSGAQDLCTWERLPGAGSRLLRPGALQGTKLEMPLWLAKGLYDNKRRILSVELPKVYKESWRTVFSADASVVDLHKMGPYYYRLGSQLLNFDSPENVDVAQTILQTFISRFRRIMDSSQNVFNEDTSALVAQLDELERALFQAGQKGLSDFQCWEMGQASQITVSSLVQNYKKRKFTDLDT
ncbi:DNA replication complex GINS protein PSF3 isoform X1 [Varanus komodoensis]|uniref:DNA replication complex GINS protein PSF3 isoform X1 n=1 Tax=Varanus komodoensis TaxID=61221 RepID=UPI001CF7BF5B|nr:DNA replication complex GINS protein PSF3 isoform X1 [Varanus komodoensis]